VRVVGLFGGMFDPPHLGHVAAAEAALAGLGLDELVVTVAKDPRHRSAPVAPAELRLEMTRAAFADVGGAVVSDLELRRDGPTYTIDTVEALLDQDHGSRIVVVVGADAAAAMGRWHRAGELAALVEVGVVPRSGGPWAVPAGFRVRRVDMAPVDLSSSGVRAALLAGADPGGLLPRKVVPLALASRRYSR